MKAPAISVLLSTEEHLETLQSQECTSVELLTWEDGGWHERAAKFASSRGWSHRRVESADEAVTCSTGEFLIVWTVFAADGDALDDLLRAALEQPDARGSIASNFDPSILLHRDEFLAASGRRSGMAQAGCRAMAHGGTAPSRPTSQSRIGEPATTIQRHVGWNTRALLSVEPGHDRCS